MPETATAVGTGARGGVLVDRNGTVTEEFTSREDAPRDRGRTRYNVSRNEALRNEQIRNEKIRRDTELSKLGASNIKEKRELAKKNLDLLSDRTLTQNQKLQIQREFLKQKSEIEQRRSSGEQAIRSGKSYDEVKGDLVKESNGLPQINIIPTPREKIMVQNPQVMGRRTIDVNQPKYVEGEKVYGREIFFDVPKAYFKGAALAGTFAGKKTEQAFEKFAPDYKGVDYTPPDAEYFMIKKGSISPDESPYERFEVPGTTKKIFTPKKVTEGVKFGTELGIYAATPAVFFGGATALTGTEKALTADTTSGRLLGAAEAGFGTFIFTKSLTKSATEFFRKPAPEAIKVETSAASSNTREKIKQKLISDLESGAKLEVSQAKRSSAQAYESKVTFDDGSTKTYQFLDFGKGVKQPNQLFTNIRKIYGAEVGSRGQIKKRIIGADVSLSGEKGSTSVGDFITFDVKQKPAAGFGFFKSQKTVDVLSKPQGFRVASQEDIVAQKTIGDTTIAGIKGTSGEIGSSDKEFLSALFGKAKYPGTSMKGSGIVSEKTTSAEVSFQSGIKNNKLSTSLISDKKGFSFGKFTEEKRVGMTPYERLLLKIKPSRSVKNYGSGVAPLKEVTVQTQAPLKTSLSPISGVVRTISEKETQVFASRYAGLGLYEQSVTTAVKAPTSISSSLEGFTSQSSSQLEYPTSTSSGGINSFDKITGVVRTAGDDKRITSNIVVPTITSKVFVDTVPKIDTRVKTDSFFGSGSAEKTSQGQGSGQGSGQGQGQGEGQGQRLVTRPVTQTPRVTPQVTILKQKPKIPRRPKIPVPIIQLPKVTSKTTPRKNRNKESLFKVFGRRFGKDLKVLETKSKSSAKVGLVKFLKGTLGRSGFIEKGGEKIKLKIGSPQFRLSKKDPRRVVQKRKFSLGTGSETSEIQYFKKKKKKKGKKKVGFL